MTSRRGCAAAATWSRAASACCWRCGTAPPSTTRSRLSAAARRPGRRSAASMSTTRSTSPPSIRAASHRSRWTPTSAWPATPATTAPSCCGAATPSPTASTSSASSTPACSSWPTSATRAASSCRSSAAWPPRTPSTNTSATPAAPCSPSPRAPGRAGTPARRSSAPDRVSVCSGRDDREVGVGTVEQADEPLQHTWVPTVLDAVKTRGRAAEQAQQLRFSQGQAEIGLIVGRAGALRWVGVVDQRPVRQGHAVVLLEVGQLPVDRQVLRPRPGPVDEDGDGVEELLDGERLDHPGAERCDWRGEDPLAQLLGAHQVEVAPGAVLGAVAEPLVGLCKQLLGLMVVGLREHDVVEQLCGEAGVAVAEVAAGLDDHLVRTAHAVHVAHGGLLRWVWVQRGGVAVEPAHVALVDGLDVVADRAVVAAGMPGLLQRGRQLQQLGDLAARVALVEQPQGLVVQLGVQVALLRQQRHDRVVSPRGPGWRTARSPR